MLAVPRLFVYPFQFVLLAHTLLLVMPWPLPLPYPFCGFLMRNHNMTTIVFHAAPQILIQAVGLHVEEFI